MPVKIKNKIIFYVGAALLFITSVRADAGRISIPFSGETNLSILPGIEKNGCRNYTVLPPLLFRRRAFQTNSMYSITDEERAAGFKRVSLSLTIALSPNVIDDIWESIQSQGYKVCESSEIQTVPLTFLHVRPLDLGSGVRNIQFLGMQLNRGRNGAPEDVQVHFRVPNAFLEDFKRELENGIEMSIRYAVPRDPNNGWNKSKDSISITPKIDRDFFGDSPVVWATRHQIMELFLELMIENSLLGKSAGADFVNEVMGGLEQFMNEQAESRRLLADLPLDAGLSSFRLHEGNLWLAPVYAQMTEETKTTFLEQIKNLQQFHSEFIKKEGTENPAFTRLFVDQKHSSKEIMTSEDERKTFKDLLKQNENMEDWKKSAGFTFFKVTRGDVQEFLSGNQWRALRDDPDVEVFSVVRNTKRNTFFERQKIESSRWGKRGAASEK